MLEHCGHKKCLNSDFCLYSDLEIKKKSAKKESQDQHYITKSLIENWVIDTNQKAIKYFNGSKIEKRNPSYRKVFFYVDEWDRSLESEINKLIEAPVNNHVLKGFDKLTQDQENKLISFAFLQSLRKLHAYNPEEAQKNLNGFVLNNNYLSQVMNYRFEKTKVKINLPEQGVLSFSMDSHLIHILPVSPYKLLILANKSPFFNFNSIKIDDLFLKQLSFGLIGQRVVLVDEAISESLIIENQSKNALFYRDQQKYSEDICDYLFLPIIYESIKSSSNRTPSKEYCLTELKITKVSKKLPFYLNYFRVKIFKAERNLYSQDTLNKMKEELRQLREESLICPIKAEEKSRNTIAKIEKINPEDVDDWIECLKNQYKT